MAESREPAGAVLVSRAREAYGSDDVQVDDDAAAVAVDGGVWVQAWLWVPGVDPGSERSDPRGVCHAND